MPEQYLLPFVKGLNTDQGVIGGDPGFTRDEANVPIEKDGSRKVRYGLDFDTSSRLSLSGTTLSNTAFSSFTWENAGNKDKNFIILQQGSRVHVFDAGNSDTVAGLLTTIILTPATYYTLADCESCFVQYAVGNGHLFIAGSLFEPCRLSYNGTTVTQNNIEIEIRDIYGIPDGVDMEALPSTIDKNLKYNLFNAGWYQKINNRSGAVVHVLDEFFTKEGNFPAKIYQWWRGKREANYGQFFSEDLKNIFKGRTEAPKGHYILNAFRRNNSRGDRTNTGSGQDRFLHSVNGDVFFSYTQFDEEKRRPCTVAWYAGRIFWAGVNSEIDGAYSTSPDMTGYVFYSQTIRSDLDYGKCYQEADPTREDDSGIVATDGGFLCLPGVGRIHKLVVIMDSLLVLADRQILAIRGGDAGFTAEDQQTYKILDTGIAGPGCAVVGESSVFVWAKDGIYSIGYDNQAGGISAQNLSSGRVQGHISLISPIQQTYMQSIYDSLNKKVSWWYNTDSSFVGAAYFSRITEEFTFDVLLNAFSKNTVTYSSTYMVTAPFYTASPRITALANNVVVGSDAVVTGSDNVTIGSSGYTYTANKVYAFIVDLVNASVGVGYYKNTSYKDFNSLTYAAYLQGNNDILGSPTSKKYPQYIRCQFKRTETSFIDNGYGQPTLNNPSSCKLLTKWDYTNSDASGKWSTEQEVYRFTRAYMPAGIGDSFDYGQEVITTKTKVMGTGRALAFKFSATAGKGYHFLGYSFDGVSNNAL